MSAAGAAAGQAGETASETAAHARITHGRGNAPALVSPIAFPHANFPISKIISDFPGRGQKKREARVPADKPTGGMQYNGCILFRKERT